MYPGIAEAAECKQDRKLTAVEEMREQVKMARRRLAVRLWDFFDSFDNLDEKEFMEVVSELDGDGVKISQLIEKFKKYKAIQ